MLSFAALSETAIAESTTVLDASAFMPSASVTSSAGTINTIHLTANIESPSASSTTAAGSLQVNIEEDLSSVSATTTATWSPMKRTLSAYSLLEPGPHSTG